MKTASSYEIADPFDELQLTDAALYGAREGAYLPERLEGWTAAAAPRFCGDDDVVRFMLAERSKIALGDMRAHVAEPFRAQGLNPDFAAQRGCFFGKSRNRVGHRAQHVC